MGTNQVQIYNTAFIGNVARWTPSASDADETLINDGSKAGGNTIYVAVGGDVVTVLPAPPGMWVPAHSIHITAPTHEHATRSRWAPASECLVYREPCPVDEDGIIVDANCPNIRRDCSLIASSSAGVIVDGSECPPTTNSFSQPCAPSLPLPPLRLNRLILRPYASPCTPSLYAETPDTLPA